MIPETLQSAVYTCIKSEENKENIEKLDAISKCMKRFPHDNLNFLDEKGQSFFIWH